ncbi:hypothetical protein HDV02_001717 [Globomyces sp. JEL0801]|nr:hypothetical protein HDV02_001717 [Globomyces sp. JEL0801]
MSDDDFEGVEEAVSPTIPSIKLQKKDLKVMLSTGEQTLDEDIDELIEAIKLFLNSKVNQAEKLLQTKYGKTLYHTHGTAVLAVLKGVMTFDSQDIQYAMDSLKNTVEASSYLRKEQSFMSSFSGMVFGSSEKTKLETLSSMTRYQKHAEIIFAESYLLKAVLSLITEANMVTFMKDAMAIRHSYSVYKICYKYLQKIVETEGKEGLVEHDIDSHFVTGVYLGMGAFNLMLSILPQKLLRIFEMIGFGGHRDFGMKCLALGAQWSGLEVASPSAVVKKKKVVIDMFSDQVPVEASPGTRKFLCDIILHTYHIVLATMVQLPGCDVPHATKMMDINLTNHPNSFLYLIFKGKLSQSQRNITQAIEDFNRVVTIQKDWRQLAHVCFWELAVCHAAIGKWEKAAEYADILYKENKWSKSIYLYLKGTFLYCADPIKFKSQIADIMKEVPKHLKKVAGKSIPLEKFVARKARKYFIQNERLLIPGLEILYMWNGFDLIPEDRLKEIVQELDTILEDLDDQQSRWKVDAANENDTEIPYETYYDDLCLARFFKGLATREIAIPNSSMLVPECELFKQKISEGQEAMLNYSVRQLEFIALQADQIEYDHWILPFARYELGSLHIRRGQYSKARLEFQAALNGGYSDDEAGKQKRKASMESSLHMRIHNAFSKLNLIEALQGQVSEGQEGEEDHSDED